MDTKDTFSGSWLIRTHNNLIAGPYSGDQVREMILAQKLGLQDEVCPASGYWITLSETQLIREFLGIEVPKSVVQKRRRKSDDEITEPALGDEEPTDPELGASALQKETAQGGRLSASQAPSQAVATGTATGTESLSSTQERVSRPIQVSQRGQQFIWVMAIGLILAVFFLFRHLLG